MTDFFFISLCSFLNLFSGSKGSLNFGLAVLSMLSDPNPSELPCRAAKYASMGRSSSGFLGLGLGGGSDGRACLLSSDTGGSAYLTVLCLRLCTVTASSALSLSIGASSAVIVAADGAGAGTVTTADSVPAVGAGAEEGGGVGAARARACFAAFDDSDEAFEGDATGAGELVLVELEGSAFGLESSSSGSGFSSGSGLSSGSGSGSGSIPGSDSGGKSLLALLMDESAFLSTALLIFKPTTALERFEIRHLGAVVAVTAGFDATAVAG